ncbi:MAG: lytic murein transglycosylase B [Burkholderiales bacterium]
MRTAQLLMAIAMVLAGAVIPTLAQAPAKVQLKPEVEEFIDQMVRKNQFEEAALRLVFGQLKAHDGVVKAISAPATAKPWHEFRTIFLTPTRISGGLEFWQQHADLLARARDVYGVPEDIVVSIIGVETIYGRRLGSFRVIDALYTLGFEMTERATFFRGEMEQFLLLARENALDPLGVKGSFAGAMGMPQFIPTSYRKYAVDFDGDGRINLWDSTADVVGSVANYLRHFGWVSGQPVTVPARISGTQFKEVLEAGLRPQLTLQQMQPKGVEAIEELPPDVQAGLFSLDAEQGQEYWLALNNFYVITRYNRSKNYAMAVYQLAKAIAHERESAAATQANIVNR